MRRRQKNSRGLCTVGMAGFVYRFIIFSECPSDGPLKNRKRIGRRPIYKLMRPPTGKGFRSRYVVVFFSLLVSFSACQTGTDQGTLQSLDSLNQFQLGFVDTYTSAPAKQWEPA